MSKIISFSIESQPFANECAQCSRCHAVLTRTEFITDDLGRSVVNCSKCGPMLLKLTVGAPKVTERRHPKPELIKGCLDCGGWMLWLGYEKPVRCAECQRTRARKRDLARYHAGQSSRHRFSA